MPKPITHGTYNGYSNRKCRCDECRAAAAEFTRNLRARKVLVEPSEVPHGKNGYDNFGCRCEICKAGNSAYVVERRKRDPERVRALDNAWAAANREKRNEFYRALYQRDKE